MLRHISHHEYHCSALERIVRAELNWMICATANAAAEWN